MDASKTSLPRQVPDAVFIPQTPLTPFNYLRFLVLQPVCLTEKCVCVCVYASRVLEKKFESYFYKIKQALNAISVK